MTPDDLLTACRDAWPETEAGRWRATVMPEWLERPLPCGWAAHVRLLPDHSVRAFVSFRVWESGDAPETPEGVREVVTALRAWVREEARRLLEEVDPPEPKPDPRTLALADLREWRGHECATDASRYAPPKDSLVMDDDGTRWRVLSDLGEDPGGQILMRAEADGEECYMTPKPDRWTIVEP